MARGHETSTQKGGATGSAKLVAIHYHPEISTEERELVESQRFRDFLPTKNGCMVFNLVGHDNIQQKTM